VSHPRVSPVLSLLAALMAMAGPVAASAGALQADPEAPAAFLPGGLLGVQIGGSWVDSKRSRSLGRLSCRANRGAGTAFDEVCFFKTSSRVAGADIHDGFIARKGDRVVLIGTGIAIQNPDDPRAEAVMREFQSLVHAHYQQTGDDVLFVNLPAQRMSPGDLKGFSETAPVLLVELEPRGTELAVFYGYLAPVNEFSAMSAD
jgi:hypothetical protein